MGTKLFVGNLPWATRAPDLERILRERGLNFARAEVAMDRDDPRRSRGFGFVHFETESDARLALEALAGQLTIGDREIRVDDASSNRPAGRRSRNRRDRGREDDAGAADRRSPRPRRGRARDEFESW